MEKYIILSASNLDKLARIVNTAIDSGYTVHGHPFGGSVFTDWCQCMLWQDPQPSRVGPGEFKSRSKN